MSAGEGVVTEPGGEFGLIHLGSGESQDDGDDFFLLGIDTEAVQAEKEIHRLKRDALVTIHERVVSCNTEPIGGGQTAEVRTRLVVIPVSWAIEGGLQEASVSQTERPSVSLDLVGVHGEDNRGG